MSTTKKKSKKKHGKGSASGSGPGSASAALDADWEVVPTESLRVRAGFDLASFDRGSTPGFTGDKAAGQALVARHADELSELQERLFAEGRSGGSRSVLLVLQGMDTAGKGGIVRHVVGLVDPQGVAHRSFGVPTPEERKHHYLWRIRRALRPLLEQPHYRAAARRLGQAIAAEMDGGAAASARVLAIARQGG